MVPLHGTGATLIPYPVRLLRSILGRSGFIPQLCFVTSKTSRRCRSSTSRFSACIVPVLALYRTSVCRSSPDRTLIAIVPAQSRRRRAMVTRNTADWPTRFMRFTEVPPNQAAAGQRRDGASGPDSALAVRRLWFGRYPRIDPRHRSRRFAEFWWSGLLKLCATFSHAIRRR